LVSGVNPPEWIGYLASGLVLATFCMRDMVPLRAMAIVSNIAFIAYAISSGIGPVLVLHIVLLPMNAARLAQALRERRQRRMDNPANGHPPAHRRCSRTSVRVP
jgi:hypothetical protein